MMKRTFAVLAPVLLIATANATPARRIPELGISPCARDYSCVRVDHARLTINPGAGRLAGQEILATRVDGGVMSYLLRIEIERPAVQAVNASDEDAPAVLALFTYDRNTGRGEIKAYGFDDARVRHATAADLEMVENETLRAYLAAPYADETDLRAALANDSRLSIKEDLARLARFNMIDASVEGKIVRLVDALRARGGIKDSLLAPTEAKLLDLEGKMVAELRAR